VTEKNEIIASTLFFKNDKFSEALRGQAVILAKT